MENLVNVRYLIDSYERRLAAHRPRSQQSLHQCSMLTAKTKEERRRRQTRNEERRSPQERSKSGAEGSREEMRAKSAAPASRPSKDSTEAVVCKKTDAV